MRLVVQIIPEQDFDVFIKNLRDSENRKYVRINLFFQVVYKDSFI